MSLWPLFRFEDLVDDDDMRAQMVLFDGFDPLDIIAPFEVLSAGSAVVGGELVVEFVSAEGPREVPSGSRAVSLKATSQLDPGEAGFIVVPGALGPLEAIPALLRRFGESAATPLLRQALDNPAVTVATVCGGSL